MRLFYLAVFILMILSTFSRCQQPRENKPVIVSKTDTTKADTIKSFDSYVPQYYSWLSEMTLEKSIEV